MKPSHILRAGRGALCLDEARQSLHSRFLKRWPDAHLPAASIPSSSINSASVLSDKSLLHQQGNNHMQAARERLRSRYLMRWPSVVEAPEPASQPCDAVTSTVDTGAAHLETARARLHSRFVGKFRTQEDEPSHVAQDILARVPPPSSTTSPWLCESDTIADVLQILAQSGYQRLPNEAQSAAQPASGC